MSDKKFYVLTLDIDKKKYYQDVEELQDSHLEFIDYFFHYLITRMIIQKDFRFKLID